MLNFLQVFNEIGWATSATVIVLVILFVPQAVNSWKELLKALGLVSKREISDDSQKKEVNVLKTELETIKSDMVVVQSRQSEIMTSVDQVKKMVIDGQIDDMRWELLDFANAVMRKTRYNKEQYDHVFDIYKKYEDILAQNNMGNGQVDMSMDFVKKRYAELLENGFKE